MNLNIILIQFGFGMIKGQNKEQAENGKTEIYIPPLAVAGGFTKPTKGKGKSY